MANGFTSGLARGLQSGLQAGSRISGRIEESQQNKRQEERQGRQDRRQVLVQNLAAATAYLNNPNIPDESKKDMHNNTIAPILEELLGEGASVPTITAYNSGIGKFAKQSLGIVEDVGKGKLSRKQGKIALAAIPEEARRDPAIPAITEDFREEGRRIKTERFEADKVFMRNQNGKIGPPTPEESQRFNRILSTPGYKEELGNAIMAESGRGEKSGADIVIKKSPVTGQFMGIDRNKPGEPPVLVPSPGFPGEQVSSSITQSQDELETLITEETLKKGTGPISATVAFMSNVFGPFIPGLSETAKENKEARKSLAVFSQRAKSALLNSSRGAIWEQQILEGRILPTSKVFTDPRAEFAGLIKLRDILKEELSFQKEVLQQPTLDLSTRKNIISNNIELETLIRQISEGESPNPDVDFVNKLTDEQIHAMSTDAFRNLSTEARDAVEERLKARQNISGGGVSGGF